MENVKVSVIVPVFNTEKYLKKCVDSIINQSLKDIEIIFIDDGSNDNSLTVLEEYAKNDKRIKIISKLNEGQGVARNIGIKSAIGEYIAFVDSDDFIQKNMLEKLYYYSKNKKLDICMCKMSTYDDITHDINNDLWYYSLGVFKNFKKKVFKHTDTVDFTCEISVTPVNKLYKRSFLINNNCLFAENLIFEDELFFYDIYLKAKRVSIIDENLYYYRINREGSTVTKSVDTNHSDILTIFKLIQQKFIELGYWNQYKIKFSNRFLHLILWRYSQTSFCYKESFYDEFKMILIDLFKDSKIYRGLSLNVKPRILKILNSKNFEEFQILDKNKLFSIVMACYNVEDYVDEAVDSIIGQSIGFESNVELILVDDGSEDNTSNICKNYAEKYPDNIFYFYQENKGQAAARNFGLNNIHGQYVNFLDADDMLSPCTLYNVYEFFVNNEIDFVSIPIYLFERSSGPHVLNYKYSESKIVDLEKDWKFIQLSASSAFFKSKLFNNYSFDEKLIISEDSIMVNKILLDNPEYGVVKNAAYNYRKRLDESSTIDSSKYFSEFYISRLKNYFINLLDYSLLKKRYVPKFIQFLLVYELQWIFLSDYKLILKNDEFKEFNEYVKYLLENIDDEVISSVKPLKYMKLLFFELKYGKLNKSVEDDDFLITADNFLVDKLSCYKLQVDIIEIRNNMFSISGFFKSPFDKNNLKVILRKKGNKIEEFVANTVKYDARKDDNEYEYSINFEFNVPLSENERSCCKIFVNYDDGLNCINQYLGIEFFNHARLSKKSNYAIYDNHYIKFKDNSFYISNYSYVKMLFSEISILFNILFKRKSYWTSALFFRFVYLVLYPFYKKRTIFLFMDRIDAADDNAEHLYKHASKVDDGIEKYFTVNVDSDDFNRLAPLGNVLPFYSFKQRFIYLFSDVIISSHPDENILNPFWGKNIQLYSGLINSEKVFLQHGVTKDNISSWLRKYDKNLSLLVTTSDIEKESFYNYDYNYAEDVVQVLGFPRFDNLKNQSDKKQILIMPSWREALDGLNNKQIKKTDYFKTLNSLINNNELIEMANQYSYKIIFKPHPNVYKFINSFNHDESVIFDEHTSYQDLFNNSSILITDYSSVAFDFAYLKKPVIYYQHDDYNFSERYFDYETMGFGEVVNDEDKLIGIIEDYFKNNCSINDVYSKRSEDFFKFKDNKNCFRVYNHIRQKYL